MRRFWHILQHCDDPIEPAWVIEFCVRLDSNHKLMERIVAAIDDLKAAIADLATELADNNAEIETLLTKITTPGTSDADVAAAVASIRRLISDNKAEVDKAKAAAPSHRVSRISSQSGWAARLSPALSRHCLESAKASARFRRRFRLSISTRATISPTALPMSAA